MGDVIDFQSRLRNKTIEVELENDEQLLLEMSIVALWITIGGDKLQSILDSEQYVFFFLQFSGVCFEAMQEELIVVDEDGNLSIASDLKEQFEDAIKDVEKEFATKH